MNDINQNIASVAAKPQATPTVSIPVLTDEAIKAQEELARKESEAPREISNERIQRAVEALNRKATQSSPALRFEEDSETGVMIITVSDRDTGEVIRQLPPEPIVKSAEQEGLLPPFIHTVA